MLQTDHVTAPLKGNAGEEEIVEFACACEVRGVEYDVVVYVGSIGMCGEDECILTLGKQKGQFRYDGICFLRS